MKLTLHDAFKLRETVKAQGDYDTMIEIATFFENAIQGARQRSAELRKKHADDLRRDVNMDIIIDDQVILTEQEVDAVTKALKITPEAITELMGSEIFQRLP